MNNSEPASSGARIPPRNSFVARSAEYWRSFSPGQRLLLKGLMASLVVLLLSFLKPLASLMVYASGKDLHSHIPLVPAVSAYLLWIDRERLPKDLKPSPGWGGLFAATGLAVLGCIWIFEAAGVVFSRNDAFLLPVLSFLLLLAGCGFFFLGSRWMKVAAFPAAFLLFMIPMPERMEEFLESASQSASADVTAWMYNMAGIPNVRDGYTFALPGIIIKVAQECSGIRSSWVLLITSLIAAHMFLHSAWRRTVFVLFVIPLGVVRNGFRILVISWLAVEIGPEMVDHWIHRRGGPVFFALSLIPLFIMLWWLRRGERREAVRKSKLPDSGVPGNSKASVSSVPRIAGG